MDRWATFDCYGTLIDWETGIAAALHRLWPAEDADALTADFHGAERRAQGDVELRYRDVLERSLSAIATQHGLPLRADRSTALADELPDWKPFPEVPTALAALRERGWKLAILSNSDPDLLSASIVQLRVPVDTAVVASEIRSYKPGHAHWHEFRRRSGASPGQHVHAAASSYHDIAPCADLGITAVWVNRRRQHSDLRRAAEIPDLGALPETLETLVPVAP